MIILLSHTLVLIIFLDRRALSLIFHLLVLIILWKEGHSSVLIIFQRHLIQRLFMKLLRLSLVNESLGNLDLFHTERAPTRLRRITSTLKIGPFEKRVSFI